MGQFSLSLVFLLDQTQDQEQLQARLGKLMKAIKRLPDEGKQKLLKWIEHVLSQQLPKHELNIQQLLYTKEGEEWTMGLKKVLADIKESGLQEGRQEGIELATQMTQEKIARQMLEKQMDVQLIAEITGLSQATIEEMRR